VVTHGHSSSRKQPRPSWRKQRLAHRCIAGRDQIRSLPLPHRPEASARRPLRPAGDALPTPVGHAARAVLRPSESAAT